MNKQTSKQIRQKVAGQLPYRRDKTPGRNTLCPCGSGKKAKRCCLNKIKFLASLPPALRQTIVADKILGGKLMGINQ